MSQRRAGGTAIGRRRPGAVARRRSRSRRAMTLLEVLIAITLIALMLGAMSTFFWQTVAVRDQAAVAADRTELARRVLARLEAELRGCVGFDEVGFPVEQRLQGARRSITFLTTALPAKNQYEFRSEFDTAPPAQHDLTQISYSLWIDPENKTEEGEPIVGGVIRTEKKTLNQFQVDEDDPLDVRNDLWSPEIAYLEFRYFDGVEWDTRWEISQGNSLPQVVQITIGFLPITTVEYEDQDLETYPLSAYPFGDDRTHADRYSTIVRLPGADRFFGSRVQRLGKQLTEQLGVGGLP